MSRVALTIQQITRNANGLSVTFAAPASTQLSIPSNDGRMYLELKNTGSATQTVTVQTPGTVSGLAIAELTAEVPITSGDKIIGPFPPALFNQSDGSVYVDLTATTTMTIALLRL